MRARNYSSYMKRHSRSGAEPLVGVWGQSPQKVKDTIYLNANSR